MQSEIEIYISSAKSDDNRATTLSIELLVLLRKYIKEFKPKIWLFESLKGGQDNKRSLQKIFCKAKEQTNINKKVSVHSLRNSIQHIYLSKEET